MENTMLTGKFILLLAAEVLFVTALGAVLFLGFYLLVKQRCRKSEDSAHTPSEGWIAQPAGISVAHRPGSN
jgi:hypothetical protein